MLWRSGLKVGWFRSSQRNNCKNSCARHTCMLYGVWRNLVADAQVSSNVRFNFCISGLKYTVNDSFCTQEHRCSFFFLPRKWHTLNISAVGEAECFRCIRACFVWGAEWCPRVSSPVVMYFQELVNFPALLSDIFVFSVRIICSIPVLRGHCCAQFWWSVPVLRLSRIVACLFFQNQVSSLVLRPHVLGWPVRTSSWMAVRPSTNSLQQFLICWILFTPYLYTPKDWRWIFWG